MKKISKYSHLEAEQGMEPASFWPFSLKNDKLPKIKWLIVSALVVFTTSNTKL